ncbi:MAG: GNAT family N-acetyltransferase [Patescibacteria group bacterium]|nr:GNAT family N-acetyltransferase [Patescibacteria group bacterium]MDD5121566.1 GNAT family N-acetyltransferase [Patescibacteria group bacterium]MDD5222240.1 GNAT family N-acetyltransferase [Patescibacteria group bacterium]MDD5396270.1 GNAT family N-acetyltransferase [Patescibacteria group bacterium]
MIKIKRGRQLSKEFIKQWNTAVDREFECNEFLDPQKRNSFSKDIFFILTEKKKIKSIARIKEYSVIFEEKRYKVLGITDMVSLKKGHGYGIKLVKSMIRYIKKTKKTEISFCHPKNTNFYKKGGFIIIKNAVKQFYYKDKSGKVIKNNWDKDLLCINGTDNLINKIKSYPKQKIQMSTKFF